MTSRRFPSLSIAVTATSAAVLTASSSISERHCAFGFGGFQCSSPFDGYGDVLFATVIASLAVLAIAGLIFLWRLALWLRAQRVR